MFEHHPDGYVKIYGVIIPLEDFLEEYPEYTMPEGMKYRKYDLDKELHVLSDGSNQVGGEFPWALGNKILAERATTFENQKKREIRKLKARIAETGEPELPLENADYINITPEDLTDDDQEEIFNAVGYESREEVKRLMKKPHDAEKERKEKY